MEANKNSHLHSLVIDTALTLFTFVFGQVYEYFGFGVTSPFMHFAFLIPLIAGVLPRLLLLPLRRHIPYSPAGSAFMRLSVITLTTGSLFRGALDIYGTGSHLLTAYPAAGAVCAVAGIAAFLHASIQK